MINIFSLLCLLSCLAHAFDQLFQMGNKLCLKKSAYSFWSIISISECLIFPISQVWNWLSKYSYLSVLIRGASFKSLLYRAHHLNLSLDKFPDLHVIITVFLTIIVFKIYFPYSRLKLKEFLLTEFIGNAVYLL